ncbi:SDR family NAD(P)-dependent oxidoreductase [Lacihabitans sp. LS3-19]|uniref:SDR family NAD(P)-dependent oxidoreductase n=1 Tax=Lacihabitans sp. LS3-19 TaxID=2487335 RepID=UPI0020CEE36C|nr:SDR family NAD(P)-dependent oxidoreductase [Lacihabitans sp. LS3-19]MCP9767417.1 SDR family NAD(P)-dependent oxidoreductase [Lacihabitans sp. LS3-19]
MNKIALITGASSGIGAATAEAFAESGINLILCGRRIEKLEELKAKLEQKVEVRILTFDVIDFKAAQDAIESLPQEWKNIDILVNNAGNAHGMSPIHEGEIADWEMMIGSNITGLLNVSKIVLPKMVERQTGHVVNLSSVAGKQTYENGAVYCATKKSVEALSEGMRLDLTKHGIKVTNIAPGAVETEFSVVRFKGDKARAAKVYEGFAPLTAKDIADAINYCVMAPDHVTIADMTIYAKAQAAPTTVYRK